METISDDIATSCCTDVYLFSADVGFLVGGSDTIGEPNFKVVLDFVKSVYQGLTISPDDTRIGLLVYSVGVKIQFNYKKFTDTVGLDKAVGAVAFLGGGGNNVGKALRAARRRLIKKSSRRKTPQILVVFVAGKSTDKVKKIARRLKKKVTIIPIGVGGDVDKRLVRTLASSADASIAGVDYPQLSSSRQDVVDMINKGECRELLILQDKVIINFHV